MALTIVEKDETKIVFRSQCYESWVVDIDNMIDEGEKILNCYFTKQWIKATFYKL